MTAYNDFSRVYDSLMSDSGVDYRSLCEFMISLCKLNNHTPKLALDACCGTGSFMRQLLEGGIDVIGVDSSEGMLNIASDKLSGFTPLLLCQSLQQLDLYGTVDTVFCTMDSLNHITDEKQLMLALSRISLFLEPGGLFVFDLNTIYKHRHILENNTFIYENDSVYLVWQNEQQGNETVNINLDMFVKCDKLYNRLNENFDERAYSSSFIEKALHKNGLEILQKCDFYTHGKPKNDSEKIIIVARKK